MLDRGGGAGIVGSYCDPTQPAAVMVDQARQRRLGHGRHCPAMIGEVSNLVSRRAGVRRNRDGAELGACIPSEYALQAVLEVDQHKIARLDPALCKSRSQATHGIMEFAIRQCSGGAFERLPDEEGMVLSSPGARRDKPWNIDASERICVAWCPALHRMLPSIGSCASCRARPDLG